MPILSLGECISQVRQYCSLVSRSVNFPSEHLAVVPPAYVPILSSSFMACSGSLNAINNARAHSTTYKDSEVPSPHFPFPFPSCHSPMSVTIDKLPTEIIFYIFEWYSNCVTPLSPFCLSASHEEDPVLRVGPRA